MGQKLSAQSEKTREKKQYFSAVPVRRGSRAQSRGQHLFWSCAVIIRLLLLLPSPFILISTDIAGSKQSRVHNSIASVVKFSVIMFGFMCQRVVKNPLTWQELHYRSWISGLRTAWRCNLRNAKKAELNDGNFVFLFNVVVETEWEDLTSGHCSRPSASIRPISNVRQKKIVHLWYPNMFYLLKAKWDFNKDRLVTTRLPRVRTADIHLNICPVFFGFFLNGPVSEYPLRIHLKILVHP